jgi:hypothetical protein
MHPPVEAAVKFIPQLLALAGSFAALSSPAYADTLPIITITSAGKITEGSDYINYFHAGGDLVGQQFSTSLTIDPNMLPVVTNTADYSLYQNYTDSAFSKGTLTINGYTYSWTNDQSNVTAGMRMVYPGYTRHSAGIDTYGIANDGNSVYASTNIWSDHNLFLTSTDITQNIVFPMGGPRYLEVVGETYVSVHPENWSTQGFVLRGTDIATAEWTVSPVPEPGEYAMLAAGLAVAGLVRRRAVRVQRR